MSESEVLDPIALLRSSGRRLAVIVAPELGCSMVFALQRVPSPAFLRLATATVAQVAVEQTDQEEERGRLAGAKTEEDRQRVRAELAEGRRRRLLELLGADPANAAMMVADVMSRVDELVTAAVRGTGIALEGVEEGLVPVDQPIEAVCRPLGTLADSKDPVFLRTIDWTELPIGTIEEPIRVRLAALIAQAFAGKREVASFRRGPGVPGDRGPAGEEVRGAPLDVAPDGGAPRNRARSRGAARRRGD